MSVVKDQIDKPMVALIEGVWRRIKTELAVAAHEVAPDLRPSHVRLLSITPSDGMRVGELAARASMTAQSLGEFVDTLCRSGYCQVVPDPADRRVRLVRPTQRGVEVARAMNAKVGDLEAQSRQQIGVHNWNVFRDVLSKLSSDTSAGPPARVP